MECRTFTPKGYVYCKHYPECCKLKVCLCEVKPRKDGSMPLRKSAHKDKVYTRMMWLDRKQQILQLAQQSAITTTTVIAHTGATPGTTANWLRKLTREGAITRLVPSVGGRYQRQPAVFAITTSMKMEV